MNLKNILYGSLGKRETERLIVTACIAAVISAGMTVAAFFYVNKYCKKAEEAAEKIPEDLNEDKY